MSEHSLPGDINQWPLDPYQLLGVSHGVAARELRQAYTRLIRQFKPEQSPAEFRRIRDAYEHIQRFGQFFAPPPNAADADPADLTTALDHGSRSTGIPVEHAGAWQDMSYHVAFGSGAAAAQANAGGKEADDEVKRLWDQACAGDLDGAYGGLRALYQRQPQNADLPLRLYWLLETDPDLDRVRTPCDWLVTCLRNHGWGGPAIELYRRAVDKHPQEGLSDRFTDLLYQPLPPYHKLELLSWRWLAAGKCRDSEVIAADLESLEPGIRKQDEEAWGRILLLAIDHLAWYQNERAQGYLQHVWRELEAMAHVHQRLNEEMSHADVLLDLARQCRALLYPQPLLELIPRSWTRPFSEVRLAFLDYLEGIALDPHRALETFDGLAGSAPVLLSQFARLLQGLQVDSATPWADEPHKDHLAPVMATVLREASHCVYAVFRNVVFQVCVRECLMVERLADEFSNDPNFEALRENVQFLYQDWPLRLVCMAHRMFWSW